MQSLSLLSLGEGELWSALQPTHQDNKLPALLIVRWPALPPTSWPTGWWLRLGVNSRSHLPHPHPHPPKKEVWWASTSKELLERRLRPWCPGQEVSRAAPCGLLVLLEGGLKPTFLGAPLGVAQSLGGSLAGRGFMSVSIPLGGRKQIKVDFQEGKGSPANLGTSLKLRVPHQGLWK